MKHPGEYNLALLAGGEAGAFHRFRLDRHVRNCEDCQEKVAEFQALRKHLADTEFLDLNSSAVNWNSLAAEMRANIHVGLEAGACVRDTHVAKRWLGKNWSPQFALAFASLLVLVGAGFFLTDGRLHRVAVVEAAAPVLQPTASGIELRKGTDSFAFLDHTGVRTDQSVNAQGAIEARYINSGSGNETGSVTITNVYLQQ
jgi:hypothetical protein